MTVTSPEQRAKLQKLFETGNKQMMVASFDYASSMFQDCVLGDPSNELYLKSFIENLKKKFVDRKKPWSIPRLSFKSKSPEQAFEAAVKAMVTYPWNAATAVALGKACEDMGNGKSALTCYRHAVDCDQLDIDANRQLGRVLRESRQYDEALVCLARIRKVKPDDQETIQAMKDIAVEKTIHKGGYEHGDTDEVRNAAAPQSQPYGETEDVMGRKMSYEETVEKRIKKNPTDPANYRELGQFYYQGGNYEKAEEYFQKVAELSNIPENVERVLDTQKQKLQSQAMKLKEEFEKNKTAELRDQFYATKEQFDEKNMELARHRVGQYPTNSTYRFELGTLMMQRSMFKEAISEFQVAKNDTLKSGDCLLALGQCFQQIKQYKLAMSHYNDAVETIKDTGETKKKVLYLAAKLSLGLKEYDAAENYANQLAAIDFSYKDIGELLDKLSKRDDN
ncbi:MAG: tetratricopeptide repeat protein [Planctomycetaceae bacterium]|jgi:tetratricopeptide (TPR) repeat protein|nr:tetratricopeptide repeat protein [Planctomycetaceae bacterium]